MKLKHLIRRLKKRSGHKPGLNDVVIDGLIDGIRHTETIYVRPNFYYFEGCGRPCYLPLNPAPRIGGKDWAVTEGWPCEYYIPISRKKPNDGPYCFSKTSHDGDWVKVIGKVRGQLITNEIGQTSDVWYVLEVSYGATRNLDLAERRQLPNGSYWYVLYAPQMWLGNVDLSVPEYNMPKSTKKLLES